MGKPYRILVGKSEGKKQFGKYKRKREDNIRMDLMKIMWECLNWIHLASGYGLVAGFFEYGSEHLSFIKTGNFLTS
jgi:hypothetical protein